MECDIEKVTIIYSKINDSFRELENKKTKN